MSVNTYLVDAATRHQVFLQRYGGSESKKAIKALNRLRRDINARLSQEPTVFQRNRLTIVLDDLDKLIAAAMEKISGQVKTGAAKLAVDEANFSATLFNKVSNVSFALPSEAALLAVVDNIPMAAPAGAQAITIDESLRQYGTKKAAQIKQIITDGLTLGDNTPDISRKLSTTMNTLYRRQLDTLVRTAANHSSSVARNMLYEENSDILEGYEWVATLDSSTTLVCGSRDGKVFQPGGPMPPAHWGACAHGSKIATARGLVPIQNVKVGDVVLTHTGSWKPVKAVMAKPVKEKIVHLKNGFFSSVSLTKDHPVLTDSGYICAGEIKAGTNLFKHTTKLSYIKNWILGTLIKNTVLIDSHNMKTKAVEKLVAYSVTSTSPGVSASIQINRDISNTKISNIMLNWFLRFKAYSNRIKEIGKHLLMKCKVVF